MELAIAQELKDLLEKHRQTLSTAESCTGGRVGQIITSIPGSSAIYLGGIISYSDEVKRKILRVPQRILQHYGAVSEQTAFYMAQNVKKLFASTWALSITGVAGPSGRSVAKPVGLVCFAWSGPMGTITQRVHFRVASRPEIQQRAAEYVLVELRKFITATELSSK